MCVCVCVFVIQGQVAELNKQCFDTKHLPEYYVGHGPGMNLLNCGSDLYWDL